METDEAGRRAWCMSIGRPRNCDLATCTLNEMTTTLNEAYSFTLVATATPTQALAFSLLEVDPTKL